MPIATAPLAERLAPNFEAAVGAGAVPGVIALVTDAQADRWIGTFGERCMGGGVPMTADTIGWIASMTKPLTTAAALLLVERDQLDLDEPAARWLPVLAEVQVLDGFAADGSPLLRPPRQAVTLRRLLTHTSGFGYDFWSEPIRRHQAWRVAAGGAGREQHRFFGFPLLFDPGTRWNYGAGIDWAGRLVEAVSGVRLGEFIAHELTGPLGMHDTRFGVRPEDRGRLASMHQRLPDGTLVAAATEPPATPQWDLGGGGMYGTVTDYARFVRLILNRGVHAGRTILRPETVAWMGANQIGEQRVTTLRSAMPGFSFDAEFMPGIAKAWTFGFQINLEPAPTGRPAGALMWAGLANSYFWIDPLHGLGAIYLSQLLPFADPKSLALFGEFERVVYGAMRDTR